MIDNAKKNPFLPVTNSGFNPGDFPLGSPESRAAARMRLARLLDDRDWVTLHLESDGNSITFTPWQESLEHNLMFRGVSVPSVWATLPDGTVPICPDCGEPFAERGKYQQLVCFQANCLERHDANPSPKNRPRAEHTITEVEKAKAWESFAKIHAMEASEADEFSATVI